MLTVRDEQRRAFERLAEERFERRALAQLRRSYPAHCEILGDETVIEVIRLGVERAKGHGLSREGQIYRYIGLMLLLGSFFDTDPQLEWAAEALGDPQAPPAERFEMLYAAAMEHVEAVAGPQGEHIFQAMEAIEQEPFLELPRSPAADLPRKATAMLERLYPAKCEALAEGALDRMIAQGITAAARHGITSQRGLLLYLCFMFMLGSAFEADPQMRWAAEALNDGPPGDPDAAVERLYQAGMAYLDRWSS